METVYNQDFSNHPITGLYQALCSIYFHTNSGEHIYAIDDIESLILLNNGCKNICGEVANFAITSRYDIKIIKSGKGNNVLEAYDYAETASNCKNLYIFSSYFEENTLRERPDPSDNSPEAIIKRNYGNQIVFEKLRKITEIFLVSLYGSYIFTEPFSKTSVGMTFSKLTTIIPARILNKVLPIEPCDITSRNIPFDKLKKLIEYPIMFNILGIDYYE
jgi:hypothetical protein